MTYGMPYTGSKNGIAETLISLLPPGKRFVDLFGGGGAMTHCAVLSGKYESVLYNEVLPLVADTFRTGHTEQRLYRQDQSKRKKAFQFAYSDFYDWVNTRDFPVYVSGYGIPDERFQAVTVISKRAIFAQTGNGTRKQEYLYMQKRYAPERVIVSSEQIGLA